MENQSSPSAATTPTKSKRSARFRIVLTAGLLIGFPTLLFLITLALVNFGLLNASITSRIEKKTGAPVRIGSIQSNLLSSFRLNDLKIEPGETGEALTLAASQLDFNLLDLLRKNHMRSVTLERPNIDLRFDPAKGWNPALQLKPASGEAIRIDHVTLVDGSFSFRRPVGGQFKLSKINASFSAPNADAFGPIAFSSTLESGESIRLNVNPHPDGTLDGQLLAGMNFERDATAVFGVDSGLRGAARIEVNATRAPRIAATNALQPVVIHGTVSASIASFAQFAPPEFKISGPISAQIDTDNAAPKSAVLKIELKDEPVAKKSIFNVFKTTPPKTSATLQAQFNRSADGTWYQRYKTTDVSIPLASAGQWMRLMEDFNIKLEGAILSDSLEFDAPVFAASGSFNVSAAAVRYVFPKSILAELTTILKSAGHDNYAIALNTFSQSGIKNLSGPFSVTLNNGILNVTGKLGTFTGFMTAVGTDIDDFTFPATDIVLHAHEQSDKTIAATFNAKWTTGKLTAEMHSKPNGTWAFNAHFTDASLPSEIYSEGSFDPAHNLVGPLTISTQSFNLRALNPTLKTFAILILNDADAQVDGFKIRIDPFSLDPKKPFVISTEISIDSAQCDSFTVSKQVFKIEANASGLFLRSPFEWSDRGSTFQADPRRLNILKLLPSEP